MSQRSFGGVLFAAFGAVFVACATVEVDELPRGRSGSSGGDAGATGEGGTTSSSSSSAAASGGVSTAVGSGDTSASTSTGAGATGGEASSGSGATGATGGTGGTGGTATSSGAGGDTEGGSGAPPTGSAGAGPDSGTELFFDDFEDENADGWIPNANADWDLTEDGSWVYRQETDLEHALRASAAGDSGWTDVLVEARVKILDIEPGSTGHWAAVFGRFQGLDNHYYVALRSDGKLAIRRRVNGSTQSISDSAGEGIEPGTWYTVGLEIQGTSLRAYLDGDLLATATDSELDSGGIAVGTDNASAVFDDVRVTVP
jgi:hypothetical protein